MNGCKRAAFAAAVVMAAGLFPSAAVQGQSRDRLVHAIDVGRGARLGISVSDVEDSDSTSAKAAKSGVIIDTVEPGGPADKAGLKPGDAITEFDSERVRSVRQFARLVQETPPERTLPMAVFRGGQRMTVNVTAEQGRFDDDFSVRLLETPLARLATPPLPPMPPAAPRAPAPPAPPAPGLGFEVFRLGAGPRLGISIESLDDQLAQYFGVKDGTLVRSVTQGSAGEKAGLKAGDVITAVNGRPVYDTSDVTRALDRVEGTGEFTLDVMRDRKPQTLKGKLEPRQANRKSVM
ncbi:MAG TPA: PDZ domain-containing protein [Vicinamibacterales bacterium]|jgi:serine protease Do